MKSRCFGLALAVVLTLAAAARAHFVWVVVVQDKSGQPAAQVYFSELAEPDNEDLLERILTIQVTAQGAEAKPQPVTVKQQTIGSGGALVGAVPVTTKSLSTQIKYGVLTRRDQTFLLQYYAKYLDASAANLKVLARDERLALDIVPHATDKGYSLEVLYQGQPVAGSEFVIFDPAANQIEAKSDAQGRVELAAARPGLYSIRAKWVVAEKGQEGDKEYAQVNHYSTLALRVPAR